MHLLAAVVSSLVIVSSTSAAVLHQHVVKRSFTDICATLNAKLKIDGYSYGELDACICLSTVPAFISANAVAQLGVNKVGYEKVEAAIEALINGHNTKKTCHYPTNAKCAPEICTSDPCTFTCENGFVPYPPENPTTCECPKPKVTYNGQCVDKPPSPSHVPKPPSKRNAWAASFLPDSTDF